MLTSPTMGIIIAQIVAILLLVLLLGLIAYGDWRNSRMREAEEAVTRQETALEPEGD